MNAVAAFASGFVIACLGASVYTAWNNRIQRRRHARLLARQMWLLLLALEALGAEDGEMPDTFPLDWNEQAA